MLALHSRAATAPEVDYEHHRRVILHSTNLCTGLRRIRSALDVSSACMGWPLGHLVTATLRPFACPTLAVPTCRRPIPHLNLCGPPVLPRYMFSSASARLSITPVYAFPIADRTPERGQYGQDQPGADVSATHAHVTIALSLHLSSLRGLVPSLELAWPSGPRARTARSLADQSPEPTSNPAWLS